MLEEKKIAIITGAGRGIGKAIALKLAALGYQISITGRNLQLLNEVKAEVETTACECLVLPADLEEEDAPGQIIAATMEHFGQIDVLVNNAGMAHTGPLLECDLATWEKIHRVNARAPFFLCRNAIPYLELSSNPIIINIGSVVGFKGYSKQSAYASSKHALSGFSSVLAKEVQPLGIKVHLISPGGVNTEMVREMRPDINTGELIQPDEIAELVEFLVTRKGKGTIDHLYIRRYSGLAFD